MHNIYSYHAKFNPMIPRKFIKEYSKENDVILDPFCGCGTTLLEGIKLKRNVIGVDLSPIGILCSEVKTSFYEKIKFKKYSQFVLNISNNKVLIPEFPDREVWFCNDTLNILGQLNYNIQKIEEQEYKKLFFLLLLSILNKCARTRKTWNLGYLADNVLPNLDRDVDVIKLYNEKINQLFKRKDFIEKEINQSKCIESDILDFSTSNIDLIVTSPPYPFAVDFIRYHRLALYWMGEKVEKLCEKETGARNKRNRKGAIDDFFCNMEKIYIHITKMVKPGGYWCMTIGNTTRNKEKIDFVDRTIKIFEENGWKLNKKTFRYLKQQTMAQKRIKREYVLIFQKL